MNTDNSAGILYDITPQINGTADPCRDRNDMNNNNDKNYDSDLVLNINDFLGDVDVSQEGRNRGEKGVIDGVNVMEKGVEEGCEKGEIVDEGIHGREREKEDIGEVLIRKGKGGVEEGRGEGGCVRGEIGEQGNDKEGKENIMEGVIPKEIGGVEEGKGVGKGRVRGEIVEERLNEEVRGEIMEGVIGRGSNEEKRAITLSQKRKIPSLSDALHARDKNMHLNNVGGVVMRTVISDGGTEGLRMNGSTYSSGDVSTSGKLVSDGGTEGLYVNGSTYSLGDGSIDKEGVRTSVVVNEDNLHDKNITIDPNIDIRRSEGDKGSHDGFTDGNPVTDTGTDAEGNPTAVTSTSTDGNPTTGAGANGSPTVRKRRSVD